MIPTDPRTARLVGRIEYLQKEVDVRQKALDEWRSIASQLVTHGRPDLVPETLSGTELRNAVQGLIDTLAGE